MKNKGQVLPYLEEEEEEEEEEWEITQLSDMLTEAHVNEASRFNSSTLPSTIS